VYFVDNVPELNITVVVAIVFNVLFIFPVPLDVCPIHPVVVMIVAIIVEISARITVAMIKDKTPAHGLI
jgi:hypothetical protein